MGRMGGSSKTYTANPNDYKLLEEIGYGASATVYRAIFVPFNEVVAVKCLDLDRCNSNLVYKEHQRAKGCEPKTISIYMVWHAIKTFHMRIITPKFYSAKPTISEVINVEEDDMRREAQTMSLIDHPNVIRAFCSFVVDRNLWVVMPFMAEGSCLHLMKIAYPDGFDEDAIASILKETLKALEYLHRQGHIHRDVKAGNILLDTNGVVKLADFGVSACMFDTGDRQRSRNTFVGTPCWMAPEVLQPGSGYNSKADIWSFGITALELAHGHAPFSKYPPMKVLLMTIQNAPPGLDYDRDKKFSKSFKEMVAMCLVKDQAKRPTAEKLLKHSFFKHAKPAELSVKKLFPDLPPLWNRVKALQLKDAAQLALKRMPSAEQEAKSQSEYQRGVSAWNFDIEDLKAQASVVRDDDDMAEPREEDEIMKSVAGDKLEKESESSLSGLNLNSELAQVETIGKTNVSELPPSENVAKKGKTLEFEILEPGCQQKISGKKDGMSTEVTASTSEKDMIQEMNKTTKSRQTQSGPLAPGIVLSHSSSLKGRTYERFEIENQQVGEKATREVRKAPSFSGPVMLPNRASANSLSAPIKSSGGFRDSLDDKSKANLVQIKGRFSVTSENLDLVKDIPLSTVPRRSSQAALLRKSASVGEWIFESKQTSSSQSPKDIGNSTVPASQVMPHLQNLFQQTSTQQDLILNLLNNLQPPEAGDAVQNGKLLPLPRSSENNGNVETAASERELLLLSKISELQARMLSLTDELNAERLKHVQLQQHLNSISAREEN